MVEARRMMVDGSGVLSSSDHDSYEMNISEDRT
jgi:hypothetical protein